MYLMCITQIRNEFKYVTWGLGLLLILHAAYLIFKIVRYVCVYILPELFTPYSPDLPLKVVHCVSFALPCPFQTESRLLSTLSCWVSCLFQISKLLLSTNFIAAINLVLCILTFLTLLVVYKNYGKGLRDQCELVIS